MTAKQFIFSAIKFLLFLGLGILLIWLAVKNLTEEDKAQIVTSILEANYAWIIFSMAIGILAHLSRAMRWKLLFAPLGFVPTLRNTFFAVMIGYLGNMALPRLGEVLRCGILKRYEKIPLMQSFGTVITERIIDLFVLFILFIVSIRIEYVRMHDYLSENIFFPLKLKLHSLIDNKPKFFLLIVIVASAVVLLFVLRKRALQNVVVLKIRNVLLSFWKGIRSVVKIKNPYLFIFHTLFIWTMYVMSVYVCVFAFKETASLSFTDCLAIMCFGSLGIIATPGGIGAYQWIVLQIMLFWGYTTAIGVAFGWVVWLAQTVVILIGGLLSFVLLEINNKKMVAPNPEREEKNKIPQP